MELKAMAKPQLAWLEIFFGKTRNLLATSTSILAFSRFSTSGSKISPLVVAAQI
jgi:hypothetical protein